MQIVVQGSCGSKKFRDGGVGEGVQLCTKGIHDNLGVAGACSSRKMGLGSRYFHKTKPWLQNTNLMVQM